MKIDSEKVRVWAIARALNAANLILEKKGRCCLYPSLLDGKRVGFGKKNPLVFSETSLLIASEGGRAIPCLKSILGSPILSTKRIARLLGISRHLKSNLVSRRQLDLMLIVGLEVTACYMNYHFKIRGMFEIESGHAQFFLNEDGSVLASILKNSDELWVVKSGKINNTPSVRLGFKDILTGIESCMGILDHNRATALGEFLVKGRIPLIDKIGYASRFAFSELSFFK